MEIKTTRIYREIEKAYREGYTTVSEQGSSRSAKTYNTLIWLVAHCLSHPKTKVSVVRASLPALKRSVYKDFEEIVRDRFCIWDAACLNKSDLTYTLPGGSLFEFFSSDSDQKLRGSKRDVLFVNEANELTFLEWQQLKMRTTRLAIIDYNPSFSDEHWINGVNADRRTRHFISTYRDNPFLEQTVIDEIESLREKNPSLWRIYGLGEQSMVEGLVFPAVTVVGCIPGHIHRRWVGVDFGFTHDPTAIIMVAEGDGRLYLDQLAYATHMLSGDIIAALKAEAPRMKVISESADPRLIQEIYRAGLDIHPVRKFPGSIAAGLMKMQEYELCVTRRSAELLRELRNYTWRRDKEDRWLNEPIDCYNHGIDAARYVVMNEIMGGERRKIDLGRLQRLI